jgi:NDP-sugar pyrophosphorylase family protein
LPKRGLLDGIILAAGKGTRMLPLTLHKPKPLLVVQGRPLLEWSLLSLRPVADRVIVVVAYLKDQIDAYMRQQDVFSEYVLVEQQPEPLGTGHALQCCAPYVRNDTFMVINGDDLYNAPGLRKLAAAPTGVLGAERFDSALWGVLVKDRESALIRIHEKPPEGLYTLPVLVNTGAYKLNCHVFEHRLQASSRSEYEITDYVTWLAGKQAVQVVQTDFWYPVGTPADLEQAQQLEILSTGRT